MSDLISRQAVIDYLESISNMDPKERGAIIFSVELLPSVHPKVGRWKCVDDDANVYKCTACGEEWYLEAGTPDENNMRFCSRCGANMAGKA